MCIRIDKLRVIRIPMFTILMFGQSKTKFLIF